MISFNCRKALIYFKNYTHRNLYVATCYFVSRWVFEIVTVSRGVAREVYLCNINDRVSSNIVITKDTISIN